MGFSRISITGGNVEFVGARYSLRIFQRKVTFRESLCFPAGAAGLCAGPM